MSDEKSSTPDVKEETTNAEGVNESAETKLTTNDTIPRARLNEVISKNKDLEARLLEFEKAEELKIQKQLEDEGNYKEALSRKDAEIERLKPFEEELGNVKKTLRAEVLESMSEEDQEEFGDLPFEQLKKVAKRLKTNINTNPVDDGKPSQRQFVNQTNVDFLESTKGMTSKQRQAKWMEKLKSNN